MGSIYDINLTGLDKGKMAAKMGKELIKLSFTRNLLVRR
jgi:hypothetical protein